MRQGLQPIKITDRKCGAFLGISNEIKKWSIFIPLIGDLKHDSMFTPDSRHWKKVKDTLKQDFTVGDSLALSLLWNLRLYDFKDIIEEITEIAEYLVDVLTARKEGRNPWDTWQEKLPTSYFERRWGAAWKDNDKDFWDTFKSSLKSRKK